jgi:hypothetical protein
MTVAGAAGSGRIVNVEASKPGSLASTAATSVSTDNRCADGSGST